MTKLTICDFKDKICFKQFSTKEWDKEKPSYKRIEKLAQEYQAMVCKRMGLKNNGLRIGTHINIFNEITKAQIKIVKPEWDKMKKFIKETDKELVAVSHTDKNVNEKLSKMEF